MPAGQNDAVGKTELLVPPVLPKVSPSLSAVGIHNFTQSCHNLTRTCFTRFCHNLTLSHFYPILSHLYSILSHLQSNPDSLYSPPSSLHVDSPSMDKKDTQSESFFTDAGREIDRFLSVFADSPKYHFGSSVFKVDVTTAQQTCPKRCHNLTNHLLHSS
jgi:hypothetical protein